MKNTITRNNKPDGVFAHILISILFIFVSGSFCDKNENVTPDNADRLRNKHVIKISSNTFNGTPYDNPLTAAFKPYLLRAMGKNSLLLLQDLPVNNCRFILGFTIKTIDTEQKLE